MRAALTAVETMEPARPRRFLRGGMSTCRRRTRRDMMVSEREGNKKIGNENGDIKEDELEMRRRKKFSSRKVVKTKIEG